MIALSKEAFQKYIEHLCSYVTTHIKDKFCPLRKTEDFFIVFNTQIDYKLWRKF